MKHLINEKNKRMKEAIYNLSEEWGIDSQIFEKSVEA